MANGRWASELVVGRFCLVEKESHRSIMKTNQDVEICPLVLILGLPVVFFLLL
jgi:hypothetical protein